MNAPGSCSLFFLEAGGGGVGGEQMRIYDCS